jgi:RHH-type proline utilization regulon transcriptional repressor/proline dehydrogenase/delta 1-pyrroline-5-carboxylate dehydrogenase
MASVIERFELDENSPYPENVQRAAFLARFLQDRANELQTPQEHRQQAELDRMIKAPEDKATLIEMTDQAFRAKLPRRAVDQLTHILDVQGIPRFFSVVDRALLRGFQSFGGYLPGVSVPFVKGYMQKETANVILPAELDKLATHLKARNDEGVRMNVNFLGEAILGEKEALRRVEDYLAALQQPEIEVVSVKISTIFSQISPLARTHTVATISKRMELLYRAAEHNRFVRPDGQVTPKFVYMDMEEYRDMDLTVRAFMQTLDLPGLKDVAAGIVLQSYTPDSFAQQRKLNAWARDRVAAGGAPITIRLVKGANMEMERVEASGRGWAQATYNKKRDTDANFKRMLLESVKPENLAAVRVGVASHILFDLAFAVQLAVDNNALDKIQFEMLEGMANHQRRALFELTQNLLLYSPACHKTDFIHAIGYLIRRLDENTGPDNFLSHAFNVRVDSDDWRRLEQQFLDCFSVIETISDKPRRTQDRNEPPQLPTTGAQGPTAWQHFINEPDTDFSLPHNTSWAEELVETWQSKCGENATDIPLFIAGEDVSAGRATRECLDPSRPGVVVGRYRQATIEDIAKIVECAKDDEDGWRTMSHSQLAAIMRQAAHEIRVARGDLMGAAMADGGKTVLESDPEVSEAVDFVEFYTQTAEYFHHCDGAQARGKGVVVVAAPWNFPIAIPCGGVAAALAAGNTVILKPASDTVLVAHLLCECFWRAGVSKKALQLIPCSGATVGQPLVCHDDVDVVILTGGTDTALRMLRENPSMNLLAETGGKNATIVTAMSDRDQAIKHVLHSAFGHSGQKCSATSLLILEEEVYNDENFRRALCDAVASMDVGSAWDLQTKMGPLIRPADGVLGRGLKELETGESWAVMPDFDEHNPCLVTPGVKWGVRPNSFTHMTELFGPVLGVMKAKNLHEAISLVNATGFGLTSGLESLDDREQETWLQNIRAGNLYVNRSTTGAIVLRQPFGGMGKSAVGPGIKAGGPNYVAQLMDFTPSDPSNESATIDDPQLAEFHRQLAELASQPGESSAEQLQQTAASIQSYVNAMTEEFGRQHDHFRLIGQDNLRSYLPVAHLRIRLHPADNMFEICARIAAARAAGCQTTVSIPPGCEPSTVALLEELTRSWAALIEFVEETEEELAQVITTGQTDRLRYAAPDRISEIVERAAAETGLFIASSPVLPVGRVELLWYLEEQSVCIDYHRYGNLGGRSNEQRAETL